jgi:hypothetical protein
MLPAVRGLSTVGCSEPRLDDAVCAPEWNRHLVGLGFSNRVGRNDVRGKLGRRSASRQQETESEVIRQVCRYRRGMIRDDVARAIA